MSPDPASRIKAKADWDRAQALAKQWHTGPAESAYLSGQARRITENCVILEDLEMWDATIYSHPSRSHPDAPGIGTWPLELPGVRR